METSAKTAINVNDMFYEIGKPLSGSSYGSETLSCIKFKQKAIP